MRRRGRRTAWGTATIASPSAAAPSSARRTRAPRGHAPYLAGLREVHHQRVHPPHERRPGSSSCPPSASSAWSNSTFAQSAKRASVSRAQALHQRMLRIDLEHRLAARRLLAGRRSMRSRLPESSPSPTTRQAGDSVRRASTRTSLTRVAQRALMRSSSGFELAGFRLLLAPSPPRRRACRGRARPCATERSGLPSNSVQRRDHPLVDAVGQQQHLDALLAEDLEVRAVRRPRRTCPR